jgi:signal transduction histidine kinase
MDSLRKKLTFSYGSLILILLAVGGWSVINLVRLGRTVNVILANNYKSIIAAENMKEALERQDSAATFYCIGDVTRARQQFAASADAFKTDFGVAAGNITEAGEAEIIADIREKSDAYQQGIRAFLNPSGVDGPNAPGSAVLSQAYFSKLYPAFIGLKGRLDDLLHINQQAMVVAEDRATRESRRAQISTAVIVLAGLILAVLFSWRFSDYIAHPLSQLADRARRIADGDYQQHLDIQSQDEIGVLAQEFNTMARRLRDVQKSDYWRLLLEQKKANAVINSIYEPVIVTDARGTVTRFNRAAERLFAPGADDSANAEDSINKAGAPEDETAFDDQPRPETAGDGADPNTNLLRNRIGKSQAKPGPGPRGDNGRTEAEFNEAAAIDGLKLEGSLAGDRILGAVKDAVSMQRPVAVESEALVPIKVEGAEHQFRLRTTPIRDEDGRLLGAVTLLEDVTSSVGVDLVKSEFISVASGKLREPLHSLRLALHALMEGYAGEVNDEQLEMLHVARDNAQQLDDMTSDLLELAELESGARYMELEPVRPIDIARAAIERHRPEAECKRISLKNKVWSDMPMVNADKKAIKRVLDNLLSNAVRHSSRDGEVAIEAWERNNRVFFSVQDAGEGIPEEYLATIFGRFVRVKGRPGGGTGLGLAIAKRLVEAQGGQISVESRAGQGATFTFTLPTRRAPGVLQLEKPA